MPRRGKAPAAAECVELTCDICMRRPGRGDSGKHCCTTCRPDAWTVCKACNAKLAGQACPMCRSDYAREETAWESLPPSTRSLLVSKPLSQQELVRLAGIFSALEELSLVYDFEDEVEPDIEFSAPGVVFRALKRLELVGVPLASITFTAANAPRLTHLHCASLVGLLGRFDLALPELRTLEVEYTMLNLRDDEKGQFGLSLTRCPKLQHCSAYNFTCAPPSVPCVPAPELA